MTDWFITLPQWGQIIIVSIAMASVAWVIGKSN